MRRRGILIRVLCLALASCGSVPVPRQIQNSFPIDQPFEKVWQAIIETFSDLNLPIMNMEKVSGLIVTDWITFGGQKNEGGYCICGNEDSFSSGVARQGKFNVYVKKFGDHSCEIRVFSIFETTESFLLETSKRPCFSTGKLERDIYDSVIEKMKQ